MVPQEIRTELIFYVWKFTQTKDKGKMVREKYTCMWLIKQKCYH